tara:strand:+ start:38164 stop:38901 length:738 start_codon:yes stop_codon:yes gene_type:complete
MIKFFRKIRFDLMEKNKTGKYLKYAVGEIVLVVIGILIALSINNWNENRLSKNLSIEFHERMADELDAVIKRSNSDNKRSEQLVEYIGKTVGILKKGVLTETGRDTLNYTLQNFFQFVRIDGKLKAFQEMESTGQLGLIYNKDLKSHLLEYLATLEAISKMFDQMASQVNNTDFVDKHVTVQIIAGTHKSKLDYNFKDLVNDSYVINKMSRFGYLWQTKQYFSDAISKTSSDLKQAIIEELKSNK